MHCRATTAVRGVRGSAQRVGRHMSPHNAEKTSTTASTKCTVRFVAILTLTLQRREGSPAANKRRLLLLLLFVCRGECRNGCGRVPRRRRR